MIRWLLWNLFGLCSHADLKGFEIAWSFYDESGRLVDTWQCPQCRRIEIE